MKFAIIAVLISITFIIPFSVVYSDAIVVQSLDEKQVRWSIAASMVSIPSVLINFVVLLYIARGSSSINNTAIEIASSMSDATKGVEFSYLLPLISTELRTFIERIRYMYEGDMCKGDINDDARILDYVSKLPPETATLYNKILDEYKEVYDKFESAIEGHSTLAIILSKSDVGRYRQLIKDFGL